MKKTIILVCLLTLCYSCFGQSLKWGIFAGLNQSTFYDYSSESSPSSGIIGFHIGAFTEFTFGNFSFDPGLTYASIGGKQNSNVSGTAGVTIGTETNSVQYLQVPLNVLYNVPSGFGKFFFGGGPYVGFGISGKITETGSTYGVPHFTASGSYEFSNEDNPDFGINAVAGVHFKGGLLLTLGYGYGLKYAVNNGVKNNVASLSVGYAFK